MSGEDDNARMISEGGVDGDKDDRGDRGIDKDLIMFCPPRKESLEHKYDDSVIAELLIKDRKFRDEYDK